MRPIRHFTTWVITCWLWTASAFSQPTVQTIRVDEIRPGMKGYGLSVFRGTEPERFDVEVIDVLHGFRPDQDLILIRTPHPLLDRARGVGGMSGSPIYLEGRLAGAYAYGWPYGTDPVVGVTPIGNMLSELKRPLRPDPHLGAKSKGRTKRARLTPTLSWDPQDNNPFAAAQRYRRPSSQPGLEYAKTPLSLAGFHASVSALLEKELAPLGLFPTQGGGATTPKDSALPAHYEPGGAIAVELARGDVSVSAIGTVTHVLPDGHVLAFGHPMLDAGQVALPTATAKIVHVLVSEMRSFKIGEALQPLGTLVQDRPSTIVIDSRREPIRVPVRIKVHGVDAPKTRWKTEIASHPAFTPMLVFGVIANALQTAAGDQSDILYRAVTKIGIQNHGTIELTDHGFVSDGPSSGTLLSQLRLFPLIRAALDNPFEISRITSVDVDLHVEFGRDVLQVVDVSVPNTEVDANSDIPLRIHIRRIGHPDEVRVFTVHVPAAAAGQQVQLGVVPGPAAMRVFPEPRSLNDILQIVRSREEATSLVASVSMRASGLRFPGHVVDALPMSAADALIHTTQSGVQVPFVTRTKQVLELGKFTTGGGQIMLNVRPLPQKHSKKAKP